MISKKGLILGLLIAGIFCFQNSALAIGKSYRIEVDHVAHKRMVAITHPETNENYLVRVGNGCDWMRVNQSIRLILQGDLNGQGDDEIQPDTTHSCPVLEVEKYTHRLKVLSTVLSNTEARLEDEQNNKFKVQYPANCGAMRAYTGDYIYARQGDNELATSDRLLMPNGSQCSASYVEKIEKKLTTLADQKESSTNKKPSQVSNVKAFPRNGAAFLDWRAATDDQQIDHYLILATQGKLNTRGVNVEDLSGLIQAKGTSHTVEGLNNNQGYYFYVIAVDNEGNTSSDWSIEAFATPNSSISNGRTESSSQPDLNIRIYSESNLSTMIKWDPIDSADRYSVILENNGEREWVKTDYPRSYIRILKRPHRLNKPLKITIRAYLPKDFVEEQSLEFKID